MNNQANNTTAPATIEELQAQVAQLQFTVELQEEMLLSIAERAKANSKKWVDALNKHLVEAGDEMLANDKTFLELKEGEGKLVTPESKK